MCCFVVIAMILDNQATIGNQKDSIISIDHFYPSIPTRRHKTLHCIRRNERLSPCVLCITGTLPSTFPSNKENKHKNLKIDNKNKETKMNEWQVLKKGK